MGNQHEIRQVKPVDRLGVAIPIRVGCLHKVSEILAQFRTGHFYTYRAPAGEGCTIFNVDYGDVALGVLNTAHFTIQSGGEMRCGYNAFRDHIATITPYLEDAMFLVGDEEDYIDEYSISNGRLDCRRVHSGNWMPVDEYLRARFWTADDRH